MSYFILDGNDDFFDSRDAQERIDTIEAIAVIEREPEMQDELDALYDLMDSVGDSAGWKYGLIFIHDDNFTQHVEEWYQEVYFVDANIPPELWVAIDWDLVVPDFQQDYTSVTFLGQEYWYRA